MAAINHVARCSLVLGLVIPSIAFSQGQPPGPEVAPEIQSCTAGQPAPVLPKQWHSQALLTPFDDSELVIAEIWADLEKGAMSLRTVGLESGARDNFLVKGDRTYRLQSDGRPVPIWKSRWSVPSPDMFSGQDCSCQGISKVNGVEAEVWRCFNGWIDKPRQEADSEAAAISRAHGGGAPEKEGRKEYDWFWFATDDRRPLRFLFSKATNKQKLPLLGDAAMVNLTGLDASPSPEQVETLTTLSGSVESPDDTQVATAVRQMVEADAPAIDGISFDGCETFSPPVWPATAYSDGALYDVHGEYMFMRIYYDYNKMLELSKIYRQNGPDGGTLLDKDTTWELDLSNPDNPQCPKALKNVGIWHPDWPSRDGCKCKATIAAQTELNPSDEPVNAMSCFFGGNAYIQSWYSATGRPHMFYETSAADLDLIDYYVWQPNASIDPEILKRPAACDNTKREFIAPYCADCHGGQIGPG